MDEVDLDEAEQIRQSLAYGERKLAEIRTRIAELTLLEEDMRAVAARLRRRLGEIETR